MKLPRPREELVDDILFSLERGAIPIRMATWSREWLGSLDDKELARCWVETAEMRLNPTNSKDFSEPGISLAERHARIIEFVCDVPTSRLGHLAIELIERVLHLESMLSSSREGEVEYVNLLATTLKGAVGERQKLRDQRAKGGKRPRPTDAAKVEAKALWPDAHRKGWTATQFQKAVNDRGHAIPFETARKWLTALRKTGSC